MTGLAEALPVVPVPELRLVAPVRLDLVHNLRLGPTEGTARVQAQELGPCLLPFARIAALAAVGSGLVKAALAFALALHLTGTQHAMRHDSTA